MITRVAALDCGTHSLRLLVADVDSDTGVLTDVVRVMEIVRLGQGVDDSGALATDAIDRAVHATAGYRAIIDDLGVERVRMVATSAVRDAANRADFVTAISAVLGVEPDVISGDEEAHLSFTGAVRSLGIGTKGPVLVCDIGGGSTELVLGDADGVTAARSVDVGCVRMTERHVAGDPMTPSERVAIVADVDAALDRVHEVVPWELATDIVCVAGTATTVTGLYLELPKYDPDAIDATRVPLTALRGISASLCASTSAERAALPVMHPGRVGVIAAGSVVLRRVLERVGLLDFIASEHDILDGIAFALAEANETKVPLKASGP
jgi:exopolyphosphatase/guanosine-5'-triphosphate,3'-diphosphate pyrophosphatase